MLAGASERRPESCFLEEGSTPFWLSPAATTSVSGLSGSVILAMPSIQFAQAGPAGREIQQQRHDCRFPQLSSRTKFPVSPPRPHRADWRGFPRQLFRPMSTACPCARCAAARPTPLRWPLSTPLFPNVRLTRSHAVRGRDALSNTSDCRHPAGHVTPVICVAAYRAESFRSRCQQPSDGVQREPCRSGFRDGALRRFHVVVFGPRHLGVVLTVCGQTAATRACRSRPRTSSTSPASAGCSHRRS